MIARHKFIAAIGMFGVGWCSALFLYDIAVGKYGWAIAMVILIWLNYQSSKHAFNRIIEILTNNQPSQ